MNRESIRPKEFLTCVYYFPVNGAGEEFGEPIPVTLKDGAVDISQLPTEEQETLKKFGVPDEGRNEQLFPQHGERFLAGLLRMTSGYCRYRIK